MRRFFNLFGCLTAVLFLAAGMTSCDWIDEELDECPPTELRLRFVYDYNMFDADVFKDQVGEVTAYVFDSNGKLVTEKSESDPALLGKYGYEMVFNTLAPGNYSIVSLAFQKDSEKIAATKGAKFRVPQLKTGDPMDKLMITLDRQSKDGKFYVVNEEMPLDTLWVNREVIKAEVSEMKTTLKTVSLMRHTKDISITLRQIEDPLNIDIADYDITIEDRNGKVNYDNSPIADDLLVYTPYKLWNTDYDGAEHAPATRAVTERAAHASLMTARIIKRDGGYQNNALLKIVNKKTGSTVAVINLPEYLQSGRNANQLNYSVQEFLDREFVYKLDFFLRGDTWVYVDVRISVLSWAERIYNIGL